MVGVAVVGYGYWGPNLVRNLWEVPDARLVSVCDLRPERLAGVQSNIRHGEHYVGVAVRP